MVTINYAFREISCKVVYYGPGLSGKTTNLQYVHDRLPKKSRGDLISLATESDRTLYFDFLPLQMGDIGGFATKFQMYTVPGQVFYNATRKLVLRGVDGIVFVADSQKSKMDDNLESLADMRDNLKSYDIDIAQIPIVIQYNKRDLPDIATIEELERILNPNGWTYVEASAVSGRGVFDTMKKISKMVLTDLKKRTAGDESAVGNEDANAKPHPSASHGSASTATAVVSTDAHPSGVPSPAVATATAVAVAPPAALSKAQSSIPPTSGPTIIAAQRSTKVRRRKRTLADKLFGWLWGR